MNKRNLLFFALLGILIVAIPLTVFLQQQQQDIRQRAAGSTTLSFAPATNTSSPLVKTVNSPISLDMMVNPGDNAVSVVRFEISYDSSLLSLDTNPFVLNTTAFPTIIEGPIYTTGKIAGTVTIGSDYSKAIRTSTKIATIKFKAIGTTVNTPTMIAYTVRAQVLSVGGNDEASENVLNSTSPAYIVINDLPTPTPTNTPIPTATPIPPTLTLDADPDIVSYNGSANLMWSSTNTTSCTASNGWIGSKTISGSQSTGPLTAAKTFTLSCTGPGGSVTKSVTVSVLNPPSPTPTFTPTPTRTPTPTSTPVPTNTPIPTATPVPQATKFNITAFMHGIGNSGDNANPNSFSLSNKNPVRQQRIVTVEVYNSTNQLVVSKSGLVNYNATNGNFAGVIDMGTTIPQGSYIVRMKSPQYLRRVVPGIQTVNLNQTTTLPVVTFVTGDVVTDNALNILDYNVIVGCYSDFAPAVSCTPQQKLDADLTDDGKVNQFDYNLFLRDLSVQNGD